MKSTQTINLNGQLFNIDTDAYKLLDEYLKNLNAFFAKDQAKKEILDDIEGRMQELLIEKRPKSTDIVTIEDIEEVIKTVGTPKDFGMETEQTSSDNESPNISTDKKKKLFRNPNDKMLGGVCSGLAAFFGIDSTLIRIIVAILALASFGTILLIYLVLWILVPEAHTAEEILRMSGKEITVENIAQVTFANNKGETYIINSQNSNSGCFSGFMKISLIGLSLLILIPIALSLIVVIFVLWFAMGVTGTEVIDKLPILYATCGIFVVAIPIIALIYAILSNLFKWNPLNRIVKVSILLLWLISFAATIYGAMTTNFNILRDLDEILDNERHSITYGNGEITTDTIRFHQPLNSLEVNKTLDIKIEVDPTIQSDSIAVLESDRNILSSITASTYAGKLTLNTNHGSLRPSNEYITLKVKQNAWREMFLNGASEVIIPNQWEVKIADISLSGASELNAERLNIDTLYTDLSGASEVKLAGKARFNHISSSGASDIECEGLAVKELSIVISGSSDAEIFVDSIIKGSASGASTLYYQGSPKKVEVSTSGTSTVTSF